MPVFQFSAAGHEWRLEPLTRRRCREIAKATNVDILAMVEKVGPAAELLQDPERMLEWVEALVGDQHPEVKREEVFDDLTGEELEGVLEVVWGWIADFSRSSQVGHLIRSKGATGALTYLTEIGEKLQREDPERLAKLIASSSSSPASSASTRTGGAGGSSTGPPPPAAETPGTGPTR